MRMQILVGMLMLAFAFSVPASPFGDAIELLEFELLRDALDEAEVSRLLDGYGRDLELDDRRAAAVLISLGALEPADLRQPASIRGRLARFTAVLGQQDAALVGRIGDVSMQLNLSRGWQHEALLSESGFLDVLGEKLAEGVITGYDLRRRGVYDDLAEGHAFVYSQSSLLHMHQLVTLLASSGMDGWVYITPKVSAFLYRDDWGPASDNVVSIADGIRVVQGREVAAAFQFDEPDDRYRFDELVTRYAKKDAQDEKGLIANAWWQPFYYTDTPLEGFQPIVLIVLSSENYEATLTVLEENAESVAAAFSDSPFQLRRDRVWVNPPFYRFLNGGYR